MFTNRWARSRKKKTIFSFYVLIHSFIKQFTLTLWNPTIHPGLHHFRVPVTRNYTVRDSSGQPILAEVMQ
jgi:hypothetical protein